LMFNDETLDGAEKGLERIKSALRPAAPAAGGASTGTINALTVQLELTQKGFTEAMDDDFNTAGALGKLFDLVRAVNVARDEGATDVHLKPAQNALRELAGVMGLRLAEKTGSAGAEAFIDLLVEVRAEVRKQKLWALSDLIRERLKAEGVTIEDGMEGTNWRYS